VTVGNNGVFRGRSGADPCTGLGTPIAANLEERIQPATMHASTIRELVAENAQLRASVAQTRQGSFAGCQQAVTTRAHPTALLTPRAATPPFVCVPTIGGKFQRMYWSDAEQAYTIPGEIVDGSQC
jgi:hypothetical protein